MVFIAGQLNNVLVLPHPDDYRALHYSFLGDRYVRTICQYARSWALIPDHYQHGVEQVLDAAKPRTVAELRGVFARMRAHGETLLDEQIASALMIELRRDQGRDCGPFTHYRVSSSQARHGSNFIGELIERDGRVEYLELMHLNNAESRRAYLLTVIDRHGWCLEDVARAEGQTVEQVLTRLAKIGIRVHSHEGRRLSFEVWGLDEWFDH